MSRNLLPALVPIAAAALAADAGAQASPCVLQTQELMAADGDPWDVFGTALAVDGDTAVVGAPDDDDYGVDSGSVYVFERAGGAGGPWVQTAKLNGSDSGLGDRFGDAVAMDTDTILVSASRRFEHGFESGAVYVFVREAGVWTEQAKLVSDDLIELDHLGASVALDGETALIGAPGEQAQGIDAGSAYVFVRDGGVWTQEAKFTATGVQGGDRFGTSVALDGETALIGAPFHDEPDTSTGAAYVFVRSASLWSQEAELLAPLGDSNDRSGSSVDVEGDTAVVGAPLAAAEGSSTGLVHVFGRAGTAWSHQTSLQPAELSSRTVGTAVALEGDLLLAGASGNDTGFGNAGAGFLFERVQGAWTEGATLLADDADYFDALGTSVGLSGRTALLGAPETDDQGNKSGSAYVFEAPPHHPATVTFRNGGTNAASYTAVSADIGEELELTVLPGTTGHDQALVLGFDSPFELTLGGGQTLLILDLMGNGELINTGFHAGPVVSIQLAVPDQPALAGLAVFSQAVHAFGSLPFALSNAQDLVIGGCGTP